MYRCFILVGFVILQVLSSPEDDFYESIGCKGIFENPPKESAVKYDCSSIRKTSNSQCFQNKKFYNENDEMPTTEFESACRIGCRCSRLSPTIPSCAEINCPIFHQRLGEGCFYEYDPNSCCPEKIRCKSDEGIATCTYNNEKYFEGQSFDADSCTVCYCKKGFDGKIEEPFCRKKTCISDEKYYNALTNKCAPIYLEGRCCPQGFSCDQHPKLTAAKELKGKSEYTCEFGDKVLNIGDVAEADDPVKVTCECITPPLVTCKSNVDYNKFMNAIYG